MTGYAFYIFSTGPHAQESTTEQSVILENYFTLTNIAEVMGVTRHFIHRILNQFKRG